MLKHLRRIWRSAITGRFVSRLFAKEHPETTVSERVDCDEGDRL